MRKLLLIMFLEAAAVNAFMSVLIPWYRTLGFESNVAGSLDSIMQVVIAVMAVFAGVWADRFGRKMVYVTGQVVRVATVVCLFLVRSYWGLVLFVVLRGIAGSASPAGSALFAYRTTKDNRATTLAVNQSLSNVAGLTMPVVAGLLADRFGVKVPFGLGLMFAALALLLGLTLEEPPKSPREQTTQCNSAEPVSGPSFGQRVRLMFAGKRLYVVLALLLASFVNGVGNGSLNIVLPYTVMDRFSDSYSVVAAMQSIGALGTILVLLIGGRIADLGGRRKLVIGPGLFAPLCALGAMLAPSVSLFAVALLLATMSGNIASPGISATYVEAVDEADRATFSGLNMAFTSAGYALGALGAGFGYKISPTATWAVSIATLTIQMLLYLVGMPKETPALHTPSRDLSA